MIYRTFTTPVQGRPSAISCALRRIAYPLDCRTPEYLTKILGKLDKQR